MSSELDKLTREDIEDIRKKFHQRMYVILNELAQRYDINHDLIWFMMVQRNTEELRKIDNTIDKLTSEDIEQIRSKFHYRKNVVMVELATEYRVNHNLIWNIVLWPKIRRYRRKVMEYEMAKLTSEEIEEIRKDFQERIKDILKDLAVKYDAKNNLILHIVQPIINRYRQMGRF